jgi:hypothetical protein
VRVGFTETHDYGIVSARYQGYSAIIDAHSPDIFVPGISLENTATDCEPVLRHHYLRDGLQVVYAGSRTLDPVTEPLDYDAVAASLMGRFEQLEAIPADLKALMALKCDLDHGEGMDWSCLVCGYEKSREALASMTGAEFDAMFEEYGQYGSHRSSADPDTYKYRGFPYRKFGEILGLPDNVRWD